MNKKLIIILGPTAIGKTAISICMAQQLRTVIVSCDSRQIYREMRIGTAVPSAEQLAAVPHYFIGTQSIHTYYTAGKYELDALALLDELFQQYDTVLMAGGSGLYIDAVCHGIDAFPDADMNIRKSLAKRLKTEGIESLRFELQRLDIETYKSIDLKNPHRILRALEVCIATGKPYSEWKTGKQKKRNFIIEKTGLQCPREELYERINQRVLQMMDEGLLKEAQALYPYRHLTALKTVGYQELFDHFEGKTKLDETVRLIQQHTRNYAKKQISYWRRYDDIRWVDARQMNEC